MVFLVVEKDPTIDAMLRTIDDIHLKFVAIENLWGKLISDEALISFYHVELENIGLTDDLYIKMNARGKLLSAYENFKAGFQKRIIDNKWEYNTDFLDSFVLKIDTQWTDYFWENFRKDNSIDDALIRFIATTAMIRHSVNREGKTEDRQMLIRMLQDNPKSIRPEAFEEDDFIYLVECFDLYQQKINTLNLITLDMPLWQHAPKKNFLDEVVLQDDNASYTQKVLYYAQTEYLMKNDTYDSDKYNDWMRVVRNIISRGDIRKDGNRPAIVRSPATFDGMISLISELSTGCSNIYEYLSEPISIRSTFAKDQVEEEKVKAMLIRESPNRKSTFAKMEDNDLLRGRLEFPFKCIDYEQRITIFNDEAFENVLTVFTEYFKKEIDLPNDLRRSLLTINVGGEYGFYDYWWSRWYVVQSIKRCLIDSFRELEYFMYSESSEYFKKLILELIEKDYQQIIEDFTPSDGFPNWKLRLIKESQLLDDKSKSNYIAILEDNSCCYILKSKRPRDADGCLKIQ